MNDRGPMDAADGMEEWNGVNAWDLPDGSFLTEVRPGGYGRSGVVLHG